MGQGQSTRSTDRGQAHTLEGVIASILLVSSLVFAMQVTAVTPLSASTSSQHIENQQQSTAAGILAVADSNGSLSQSVRYWDQGNASFHGLAGEVFYTNDNEVTGFTLGQLLVASFGGQGIAFNVDLKYQTAAGDQRTREMVYRGAPSDNAVTATRSVTLYDDDVLVDEDENPTSTNLTSASSFYAPDASPNTIVYNIVRVEVTVWRM